MTVVISGTNGIQNVLGSAAAPAESNTTSSNTGLYFPTSTTLGLSTAGTNAVYIDASQNVGIGTSSPGAKLDITNNQAALSYLIDTNNTTNGGSSIWRMITRNIANTGTTSVEFYKPTGSGFYLNNNDTNASNFTAVSIGGAERMRIDSSGNLLVGTTSATVGTSTGFRVVGVTSNADRAELGSAASTNSGIGWSMYSTGAAAYRFYVGWGGTIYATSVVITAISDQRLKENVRDIETGINAIMALKPRRFDWKEGKGQDKKNAAGFIADEFETVFPECVGTSLAGEDGIEYKNINHETLIPTLVKAIQEQQTLITTLTARIEALEAK
jgi:hypothetical protein